MNKRNYRKQVPSIAAARWIDELDITPTEDHVLRVFCDFINDEYTAFPSQVVLAKRCKYRDRGTVAKALSGLLDAGHIEDTGKRKGRAVVYYVPVPERFRWKKGHYKGDGNSAGETSTIGEKGNAGLTEGNAGFTDANSAGFTGLNSAGSTSTNLQEPTKNPPENLSENISEEILPEGKELKKIPRDAFVNPVEALALHRERQQAAIDRYNTDNPLTEQEQAELDEIKNRYGM